MKKKGIVFGVVLLVCVLGMGACKKEAAPSSQQGGEAAQTREEETKQDGMTLGEAADFLIETAATYGNQIERETLLEGLEDQEGERAQKIHMLVIVSRAFGNLPEPAEEKKGKEEVNLDSAPDWAMEDLENLKRVGALKKSDLEGQEEAVTREDVENMVQRVMVLYSN